MSLSYNAYIEKWVLCCRDGVERTYDTFDECKDWIEYFYDLDYPRREAKSNINNKYLYFES